jgi:hypothetical protein
MKNPDMPLRPAQFSSLFDPIIDSFAVSILGVGALHNKEYQKAMENYKTVPLGSRAAGEDSNVNLWFYLNKNNSDDFYGTGGTPFSTSVLQTICQSFCISAFETLVASRHHSIIVAHPIVQFLRHLRNASAHGNRFNLASGQPDKPAQWNTKVIEPGLHRQECFFAFLGPGDLTPLLVDISKLLPP